MTDIAKYSVVRQGDRKHVPRARRDAVALEPALNQSRDSTRLAATSPLALTPLERIFNERWLGFFGEHAKIPREKAKPAAKVSDAPRPDAESGFAKLHSNLHAAWKERDAIKLEAVASSHLKIQASSGTSLIDPFTRDLYEFFKARGCDGTGAEIIALVGGMTTQQITDYLTSSAQLVSKLKAQAFAAMVNGTLSQQGIDLLLAIKAIAAFQLIAAAILNYGKDASKIPIKKICALLDADITFPEWTFDVDPCRWPKHDNTAANPRGDTGVIQTWPSAATAVDAAAQAAAMSDSPLKRRIEREALAAEKRSATAAAVGNPEGAAVKTPGAPPRPNLSYDCNCEDKPKPLCLPPDPCCAKINYYVTDTLVLRDTVKRYLPSDLAYIENIAAGESRSREHNFAKTIEDYSEEEVTTTKSEERDLQVTERFSVQNEIEKNLKIDADAHAEYDGKTANGKYKITADLSVTKETAQKEAREQFREAVDKAVSKLQVETRKLTTRRVTTREEEKNTHSFKNKGKTHIVAKYFYVSKEVEGQVFSHGLRTTVELLIPEPAALYEHLEKVKFERAFGRKKPIAPIVGWQTLDPKKHFEYVADYGLKGLNLPPEQPEEIWKDEVKPTGEPDSNESLANIDQITISIPAGYTLTHIQFASDPEIDWKKNKQGGNLAFNTPGHGAIWFGYSYDSDSYDRSTMGKDVSYRDTLNLVVSGTNLKSYGSQLLYRLTPDPVDFTEWRIATYQAIMEKYEAELAKYEEALAAFKRQSDESKLGRHPFANKEIILAEMKRAAIYMMCEDFERGDVMAMNTPPCGFPEINRKAASQECADWYFWETAFDWRLMSFVFFDYFWNRKCDWPEKFAPGHDDFMFNAFLRAGMGRMMVPVRPGMEADVIFYLETGQKWGLGGQPPANPQDPRWISVVAEIKAQRDCYQNDREGMLYAMINTAASTPNTPVLINRVILKGSDRYWDPLGNTLNQTAIDSDTNREIFIDGLRYRIVAINSKIDPALPAYYDAAAPTYDATASSQTMWWDITLSRPLEAEVTVDSTTGEILPNFAYAIGAEYVGAPFRWQEPTNLVWLGDQFKSDGTQSFCLPEYPVKC